MDFLSLSRGGKFDDAKQPLVGWAAYPYTGRSGYECMPGYISDDIGPFGRNVETRCADKSGRERRRIHHPGGGYRRHPRVFNRRKPLLRAGKADIIGAARQSLADPDWYLKLRLGKGGPDKSVRIYQLLRGAGYQAQTGNLPVVGTGCSWMHRTLHCPGTAGAGWLRPTGTAQVKCILPDPAHPCWRSLISSRVLQSMHKVAVRSCFKPFKSNLTAADLTVTVIA